MSRPTPADSSSELYYEDLRRQARAAVAGLHVQQFPTLRLTAIDSAALAAFRSSWAAEERSDVSKQWDWVQLRQRWSRDDARHEVALWDWPAGAPSGNLHALMIGGSLRTEEAICSDYLETWPFGNHPFRGKVIPMFIQVIEIYAKLAGFRSVLLRDLRPDSHPELGRVRRREETDDEAIAVYGGAGHRDPA
jgi:hypothetical protein